MSQATSKRGFALEGGGARGSYQIGVCKAYIETGYEFHGAVGTSIGAINAVMLASGEFETALKLWETVDIELLFDQEFLDVLKLDNNFPGNITTAFKKLIADRGIDHSKIKKFLATYINEEKARSSGIEFGLVTFSLSERKPYEVFLKDIPDGKLIDYILASAKLPILMPHHVDDNRFIDGGIINNCPINMLVDEGYDEIIAVRTKGFGLFRRYDKNANVTIIENDEVLGNFLSFDSENAKLNIKRGYCDGIKTIKELTGNSYYLEDFDWNLLTEKLFMLSKEAIDQLAILQNSSVDKKRVLFEKAIPDLADYLNLEKNFTYEEFLLNLFEYVALRKEIDQLNVYKFKKFAKLIKSTATPKQNSIFSKVGIDFIDKKSYFAEQLVNLLI